MLTDDTQFALFAVEILTVLPISRPTNSLSFVSRVSRGLHASLTLIVAEVGAYLISLSVLISALRPSISAYPTMPQPLRDNLDEPQESHFCCCSFPPPTTEFSDLLPYLTRFSAICTGDTCWWIHAGSWFHSRAADKLRLQWPYHGEVCLRGGFALMLVISVY